MGQNSMLDEELKRAREAFEDAKCKKQAAEEQLENLQINLAYTKSMCSSKQVNLNNELIFNFN
jgi:hypothetical protein